MMGHIVGLQVEVLAWQGKAKLGQRDDARDRASVAQALQLRAGSPAETAIASMIPQG
jgi:predicted FMN-binding regulatory protein PaiB